MRYQREKFLENEVRENVDNYSFYELITYLWSKKLVIISAVLLSSLLTLSWVVFIPDEYRSQVLLAPTEDSQGNGLSSMSSQLGGLASLTGLNLGANTTDKVTVALEILKSRSFLNPFIRKNNINIPLVAGEKWDPDNQTLILDPDIYNGKKWTRLGGNNNITEPKDWELYNKFLNVLSIEHDKSTGLVVVAIDFFSPELSQEWLQELITELNAVIRTRDINDTQKSIRYLNEQVSRTSDFEMRQVFFALIQEQSKKLMIAEITYDYVFDIIDPAYFPMEPSYPKRLLVVIVAAFMVFGAIIFGFVLVFFVTPRNREIK
jgi:uncharacterized protein involved in exopolysaccharide biosynthesis